MDVAVIIPLFNGSRWIRQTLNSVFSQSHPPKEVVIVDDGSEDESLEIIKSFSAIKLLKNPGKGSQFARNFGLQNTTAPLVAFLDQDDIWHPEHLRLMSKILEQFPKSPAAVASCFHFYSEKRLVFPSPISNFQQFNPWENFPINSVATPSSVVIRRNALNLIGGWSNQFTGSACVDLYMWLRLSVNHSLVRNNSCTVGYRRHKTSQGNALRLQNIQRLIDIHKTTLNDALSYRIALFPQDSFFLQKRLDSLINMSGIVEAAITLNYSLLDDSIIAFEESLADESTAFIESICTLLLWFLYPYLEPEQPTLKTLLKGWTNKAEKTRQAFRSRIALSRILPRHLLAHPFDLYLWDLLAEFVNIISPKFLQASRRFLIAYAKNKSSSKKKEARK